MAERYINAAKDGNIDILREGTRKDLNTPDEDGMTAPMWAAHNGNLEALRLIVGREGDVNKCDYLGLTALHHASMRGHIDVVSYLVHWGCNVYALDNDMHSAQDLASIHNYHDVIKFLDKVLDQKRYKNPKSVARQKEEAIRASESNQKKYEKLKEAATKKAEKEQKKFEKEINNNHNTSRPRKNIFQSITLRMKGSSNNSKPTLGGQSNFSDMAGLTYSRNAKGAAKKAQARRSNNMENFETMSRSSDFKTSVMDGEGNRTLKLIDRGQGLQGTVSGVMYMNSTAQQSTRRSMDDELAVSRRPRASDLFHNRQNHSNIYRPKSESDLLDSGTDSYYGEEEDEEDFNPSLFNRTEFGKIAFLPKNPMLNTLQSFENGVSNPEMNDDQHPETMSSYPGSDELSSSTKLPWDLDDVDGLDENDDTGALETTASALEMFLASNGLTSYLHVFSQEEVDLQLLMRMNESELKDLGLPLGPRKKLGEAIQRRKNVLERPSLMVDSYL